MSSSDWFRNSEWNSGIEEAFFAKLSRARDKAQYLRIQASTLASKHPQVALRLIERYFGLGEHWDHAQAYVDQAKAYLALGSVEQALRSYESALAVEAANPRVRTDAYLNLPFTVAVRRVKEHYQQALSVLEQHQGRLMFPVDHFRWHAAQALIHADLGQPSQAHSHALKALEAAGLEHSGFRYHPSVGLVGEQYESIRASLAAYAVQTGVAADVHASAPRRHGRG